MAQGPSAAPTPGIEDRLRHIEDRVLTLETYLTVSRFLLPVLTAVAGLVIGVLVK